MTEPASRPPSAQAPTHRPTLTSLLRARVLDPELGALVWLLLEARVPLLVAGGRRPATRALEPERLDRTQLLGALLDLLPSTARRIPVDATGTGLDRLTSSDAATAWLTGLDLDANAAPGVRLAFRSLSRGAVMAASIAADSLEAVFARLRAPDLRLTDDELTFLGVVLILRTFEPRNDAPAAPATAPTEPVERVAAAHYVRPLARDPAGHVQRPAPAVLATWEPRTDAFEHFAWGVAADLAGRAGLRPGDLDLELERRRSYLAGLVEAGLVGSNELRSALDGYRLADSQDSMG
jgi:hypothetical protein